MDRKLQPSSRKKKIKIGAAVAISVASVWVLYSSISNHGRGERQKIELSSLKVESTKFDQFSESLNVRGEVLPKRTIYLDAVSGGRVEQRLVEQGDYVEKDQPLLKLSNTSLQLNVISREAQITEQLNFLRNTQMTMETNRLNLKRDLLEIKYQIAQLTRKIKQAEPLVKTGVLEVNRIQELQEDLDYYVNRKALTEQRQQQEESIRQAQFKQLQESVKVQQENLEFARKELDNLLVKAPEKGHLSHFDVELGQNKVVGARLGQIDIPGDFKLVAKIDEYYLSQINLGTSVLIENGNQKVKAKISKIDSRVNGAKFEVEVALPRDFVKSNGSVKRGQSMDMEVVLNSYNQPVLVINKGSFVNASGGNWAFVLSQDGRSARKTAIKLGKKNQEYFEVLNGLEEGDRVVVSSYSNFYKADILILN
ncbi:multidrug resistance protein MdtN [Pseudoalteromonas sp. P1-9]|uniref:efflux RND transporter periplasmic adaptor subunit n=1 Tax=Pseudoalteromonas sp. P1-9 TaxID=1710354 RepID=UPI0006D61A4F|nr:HlyD family efflux transporter periplasmic adaptor subunit [Pseudoalteromonas sp. P1-9]KPV93755.1 multidrug resistance protein MdtN [Pseudoalteromonas sp. P1-9]